jgi:diguanylate cyclase (GGDEF)-like protein
LKPSALTGNIDSEKGYMRRKVPVTTRRLRYRLWVIIFFAALLLMHAVLSQTAREFMMKIGLSPGDKSVLTIGTIVILLISISGLFLVERAHPLPFIPWKKSEQNDPCLDSEASQKEIIEKETNRYLDTVLSDFKEKISEVSQNSETLARLVVKDRMTGLYNQSYIKERLQEELYRAERYRYSLSILMIDLDDFKVINDTHGHTVGDKALKDIAHIIIESIRVSDIPGRYGGEEFLIILPETTSQHALIAAERIRDKIEAHKFEIKPGSSKTAQITISIGVCSYPDFGRSRRDLISFADAALYQAKREGKNRTTVYLGQEASSFII